MNEKQILLIKHSWSYAAGNAERVNQNMFKHLSQLEPETKSVFDSSARLNSQQFSSIINLIVLKFQKPAELCKDLKALAEKHPELQLMAMYYDSLVIAFLMTMKKMLGDVWTNEVSDAWAMAFATINHNINRTAFSA
jgi:hemoglobin-like flavoprotein